MSSSWLDLQEDNTWLDRKNGWGLYDLKEDPAALPLHKPEKKPDIK